VSEYRNVRILTAILRRRLWGGVKAATGFRSRAKMKRGFGGSSGTGKATAKLLQLQEAVARIE
jgi:hypothetical protein